MSEIKEDNTTTLNSSDIIKDEKIKNFSLVAIGKLAAGITHEINTPLTYAKGNLEMLMLDIEEVENRELKNSLRESIKSTFDAIDRIAKIVESVKEISGEGSGKKERIDVVRTLILALRMTHTRSKHVAPIFLNDLFFSLDLDLGEKQIWIYAQKQRIEQIWIVLINNALDEFLKGDSAYENRYIKVNISKEGSRCKVKIKDNAGGIKEDFKDRLFEPFSSTKTSKGIGIGLNITHQIVTEYGGAIRAYNENGGAVFEVELPIFEDSHEI